MSNVRSTAPGSAYGPVSDERRERSALVRRSDDNGLSTCWVIASLAALGLGVWAWYHFVADLKRYIKMERM